MLRQPGSARRAPAGAYTGTEQRTALFAGEKFTGFL